jgi:hypothetical protein
MQQPLKEILTLAESNAKWLDDAAHHFEQFAAQLHDVEQAKWELLAAVYREKAQAIQSETAKVRAGLGSDGASELRLENT